MPDKDGNLSEAEGSIPDSGLGLTEKDFEPVETEYVDPFMDDGEAGQEPEPKPEPESEPEPEPEEKPEAEAKPPQWDFIRQQRDQEHAAERKRLLAEIEALKAPKEKPAEAEDDPFAVLDSFDPSEYDDEFAKAYEAQKSALKLATGRSDALQKRLDALESEWKADIQARRQVEDDAKWEQFEKGIIKQHGADIWNATIKSVNGYFHAKGYSKENPPDEEAVLARLELTAQKMAAESAATKKQAPAKPKPPAVAPDSGAGASAPSERKQYGSLEEGVAALRRRGLVT